MYHVVVKSRASPLSVQPPSQWLPGKLNQRLGSRLNLKKLLRYFPYPSYHFYMGETVRILASIFDSGCL